MGDKIFDEDKTLEEIRKGKRNMSNQARLERLEEDVFNLRGVVAKLDLKALETVRMVEPEAKKPLRRKA